MVYFEGWLYDELQIERLGQRCWSQRWIRNVNKSQTQLKNCVMFFYVYKCININFYRLNSTDFFYQKLYKELHHQAIVNSYVSVKLHVK